MSSLNVSKEMTLPSSADVLDTRYRSCADRAFDLPEVRQAILALLDRPDTARSMRWGRRWMFQVAEKLYPKLSYDRLRIYLKSGTLAPLIFASAVTEIDCYGVSGGKEFGLGPKQNLTEFCPEIFVTFIPSLRDQCVNLRMISFGVKYDPNDHFKGKSWTVTFHSTRPKVSDPDYVDTGHIQILYSQKLNLLDLPPVDIPFPPSPSPHYSIETRFDLYLRPATSRSGPALHAEWIDSLRHQDFWSHIYRVADFSTLNVSLKDILGIVEKQETLGYKRRLADVTAVCCPPFSLREFTSFAESTGDSLQALTLAQNHRRFMPPRKYEDPHISLSDLPKLVALIREMPNLRYLTLSLMGLDGADKTCAANLTDDCLDSSGHLKGLKVWVSGRPGDLPNAVRCVYGACAKHAKLGFVWRNGEEDWSDYIHADFLAYLQDQPIARRRVLARQRGGLP